ncbi:unnamed protein product [Meloidogyne enterolobii]|uniref:Uncharacterized protein n=1 Tax=Meloidogyne enterolobii TaxID=390850 RepID=A0ACB0Z6M9_MELEN
MSKSFIFVSILFSILLVSNEFFEISASPLDSCGGKCDQLKQHCCFKSKAAFIDDATICCKTGCDKVNGGCSKVEKKNFFIF